MAGQYGGLIALEEMNITARQEGTARTGTDRPARRMEPQADSASMTNLGEKLPILMTIRADQDIGGADYDRTELITEGTMELRQDGVALTYEESELTGMEGTLTTFEVSGPRVILRRTGTVSSQMVFEEGRQHTSLYETPFGELSIDIQTSYLRHTLSEQGGLMEIRYSISVEHAAAGKNKFQVTVKRRRR